MKTKIIRSIAILLSSAMLITFMPMSVFAGSSNSMTVEDALIIDDAPIINPGKVQEEEAPVVYYTSVNAAGKYMASQLMKRSRQIIIDYRLSPGQKNISSIGVRVFEAARIHTALVAKDAEYALAHYKTYKFYAKTINCGSYTIDRMYFNFVYRTTDAQERAVDAKVSELSKKLAKKSDYDKIRIVYAWIADNVRYNEKCPNAYDVLINKRGSCNGISAAVNRILQANGVECRIILGKGHDGSHAWNAVKLKGKWYLLDATWDLGRKQNRWQFFLKNVKSFRDHTATYPVSISATNYSR